MCQSGYHVNFWKINPTNLNRANYPSHPLTYLLTDEKQPLALTPLSPHVSGHPTPHHPFFSTHLSPSHPRANACSLPLHLLARARHAGHLHSVGEHTTPPSQPQLAHPSPTSSLSEKSLRRQIHSPARVPHPLALHSRP